MRKTSENAMRNRSILFAMLAAVLLGGCGAGAYPDAAQSRVLGQLNYPDAFAAAEAFFTRHFEIATSDVNDGTIESQPKPVNAQGERVLGNSPARQVAKMKVFTYKGRVMANLTIMQQRQQTDVLSVAADPGEPYSSVPNQPPSAGLAATSDKQNLLWQDERRIRAEEARILQELFETLNPQTTEPTSQPATAPLGTPIS
jgi:hypothetical protein